MYVYSLLVLHFSMRGKIMADNILKYFSYLSEVIGFHCDTFS